LGLTGNDCTLNGFLGGRLTIAQPKWGFRSGHDTVLLAAAVPAEPGTRILEFGSGAGVASLCLAARVEKIQVLGIEIDQELVELANENAARNRMAERVRFETGDVMDDFTRAAQFAHIFFNPPFHPASGQESANAARERAKRDSASAIREWTRVALALTPIEGTVTAIVRADRGSEMLAACEGNSSVIFPLFPRAGEPPKRAIIQITKGKPGAARAAAGLILHDEYGENTGPAEAVLRRAAPLILR
jgi:tRNA1Val (adenine37-N6)-methyltransferase